MFTAIAQIAKAIGGFATPWVFNGLMWAAGQLGLNVADAELSTTAATVVSLAVGAVVWAVPNK